MEPTREIMWNVTPWMGQMLYGGAFAALCLAAWRIYRRYRVWRQGRADLAEVSWTRGLANIAEWVFRRGKMRREPFADVMHALILYGFIVLLIATTLDAVEHQTSLHFLYGSFYLVFSLLADLGGLAFLVGLGMAVYRRHIHGVSRLKPSGWVDGLLVLLIAIGVTGFLVEGLRISVSMPAFEKVSFVGYPLALGLRRFGEPAALTDLHRLCWNLHAGLSIAFFSLATTYFFRHVVVSALSVALRPERARGALRPYALAGDAPPPLGAVADIAWKDLLDADACTTCGRCSSVCPATAADKPLDPRNVVLGLSSLVSKQVASNGGLPPTVFDAISNQELWDCTTCGACVAECPVEIEVFDKIIDLRRQLVDIGEVSPAARNSLEGLKERLNPWGRPPEQRGAWAESLRLPAVSPTEKPEWIYWIGCAGAFESSGQSISRAMVEILQAAGSNFVVLSSQERCTGDPARRLGDEALFQSFRKQNIEFLRQSGVRKIITHCPHCFNTFKNEYWQDEQPEFEVVHHTQLLSRLIDEGRLKLTRSMEQAVAFHDPCYLGRHNGEFDAPRKTVDAIPGAQRIEMPRTRENSLCCGGGGGQMWLESPAGQRIENLRLSEAIGTGARVVATACPFCKVMLETASVTAGEQETIQVKDISELINEAREQ